MYLLRTICSAPLAVYTDMQQLEDASACDCVYQLARFQLLVYSHTPMTNCE